MRKILKIVSWNINGLGERHKQARTDKFIHKEKSDIIFLQETHQKKDGVNELKLYWVDVYEKSYSTSKSRGVAIIVAKRCEFKTKAIKRDHLGRFLIIQGLIYGQAVTLVNIYAPNINQREFYDKVYKEIEEIKRICDNVLIAKPNKDLTNPGSYRLISLINQDAKIFTAIL
ncbi:LINE-1 retrotransposable element ORF2 protein, partial [Varanus komodoensis]